MREDDEVTQSLTLPLPPEEAWELVTQVEHLEAWLAEEVEIDLREGGALRVSDADGRRRAGEVERVEEGSRLSFHWWPEDRPAASDVRDHPTRVEITLLPVDGGTSVTVREEGFARLGTPAASCGLVAAWGWGVRLRRLALGVAVVR